MSTLRARDGATNRDDCDLLDPDTSAALLRWIGALPDGVSIEQWEQWLAVGCGGTLHANGNAVTTAMLGEWGRAGSRCLAHRVWAL